MHGMPDSRLRPASRWLWVDVLGHLPSWVNKALLGLAMAVVLYLVFRAALTAVLLTGALYALLRPLVQGLQARGLSKARAVPIAFFGSAAALCALFAFAIPQIWIQAAQIAHKVSVLGNSLPQLREQLRTIHPVLDQVLGPQVERLFSNPEQAWERVQPWVFSGINQISNAAVAIVDLMAVPFLVYFLLLEDDHWRTGFFNLFPRRIRSPLMDLSRDIGEILGTYVRSQLWLGVAMGLCYWVGFALIQVPAAFTISLIGGLLNAIPYVGTWVGMILSIGLTWADTGATWRLVAILAWFVVVQILESYLFTPWLVGRRVDIHPALTLIGLLVFGKVFGLIGLVVAIPVLAIGKLLFERIRTAAIAEPATPQLEFPTPTEKAPTPL